MSKSSIEWTEETWNPITGCSKVSTGCKNCYAEVMSKRLQNMNAASKVKYGGILDERGNFNGVINFSEKALLEPLKKKKPTMYFLSMSDLFHENVKWEWINKIFAVMALTPYHTYQILTKRPERMLEYFMREEKSQKFEILHAVQEMQDMLTNEQVKHVTHKIWWELYEGETEIERMDRKYIILPNVWLGTSVENQTQANKRIPYLLQAPAAVRFLSCEPLLGDIQFKETTEFKEQGGYDPDYQVIDYLKGEIFSSKYDVQNEHDFSTHKINGIDWVIVGGESGHNARPMHPEWAISIRNQCKEAKVPFFFKQWGAYNELGEKVKGGKKSAGNLLEGETYLEMPNHYD